MNRSGSQKALLVVSIIEIISGVLTFIGGLTATLAGGALGGALGAATPEELAEAGITSTEVGVAGAAMSLVAVLFIVVGVVAVIEGILGIRAANDSSKIMPVWILSIISLVGGVITLIMSIVNGSFAANAMSNILSLVLSGLMFWVANNIKTEAGK